MKLRNKSNGDPHEKEGPSDAQDDLFGMTNRWKVGKRDGDDGSVTNSLTMLTAIPEVDLGMECVPILTNEIVLNIKFAALAPV